jgi:hypothetical protein
MMRTFKILESVTVRSVSGSRNNRHPRMDWLEEACKVAG